jgi:hypothetical protein
MSATRVSYRTAVACLHEFHLKPRLTFKNETVFVGKVCTGVLWRRTGTSGGFLWTW